MSTTTIDEAKALIVGIFEIQKKLRALAPGYKWSGLGNTLGDYGELIAIGAYSLNKANSGSGDFDAKDANGKTVQIKANRSSRQIGIRGEADLLLVLRIYEDGDWEEIYYGDFKHAKSNATFSDRDNKHVLTISKLRGLKKKMANNSLNTDAPPNVGAPVS